MDLSKPRTPGDAEEDNAIKPYDSEDDDYENRNVGRNSSSSTPTFKDQSHRLHRSSSTALRCFDIFLSIPIMMVLNN